MAVTGNEVREVTLEEMLMARERRAFRQRKLLSRNQGSLLCFGLNTPGPVKTSRQLELLFQDGIRQIRAKLADEGCMVLLEQKEQDVTGYEFYALADCDPVRLKRWMTEIEEQDRITRLFDIDVFRQDGNKISRDEIGLQGRSCLLCSRPAWQCARSRTHSVAVLQTYIGRLLSETYGGEQDGEIQRDSMHGGEQDGEIQQDSVRGGEQD